MASLTATEHATPMVPIRLTTRSVNHAIPATTYSVPLDWKRLHLSELLNKVLHLDERVPFDFLVDGQLLRSSLAQTLESKGLTSESTLEIEYFQSVLPPSFQSSLPAKDWISDVSILSGTGNILSASYDGTATLWSSSAQSLAQVSHDLPVLSVCMAGDKLVSGGMDRRIQIHTVPADPTASQHLDYSFEYHQAPISSLRASPHSASNFLSSSWDGALALWSIDAAYETKDASSSQASGPSSKKRRKTAQDGSTFPSKALRPQQVLINNDSANGSTIHRALFDRAHQNRAWSASADHSVKCWDLEHGLSTQSRTSDKVLLDLDQMAGSSDVFVTGSTDRTVCFWDFRQENASISLALTGHTSQVSSVSAHPTLSYQALSGSHDGTLRIWDARSPKSALFTIARTAPQSRDDEHERVAKLRGPYKVLTTAWDGQLVVSGGEDCKLQMHKTAANTTPSSS